MAFVAFFCSQSDPALKGRVPSKSQCGHILGGLYFQDEASKALRWYD